MDTHFSGTCCKGTAVRALARWAVVDGCIESLLEPLTVSVLGGPCQSGDKVPTSLGMLRYGMFNICVRAVDEDFLDYSFRGKNWGQVESFAETITVRKEHWFLLYKDMCISLSFSSSMKLGKVEWGFGFSRSILPYCERAFVLSASLHQHTPVLLPLASPLQVVLKTQHHFSVLLPNIAIKAHQLCSCALVLSFCTCTLVLMICVLWALLWSYKLCVLNLWTFFSPSSPCVRIGVKLRSFY